MRTSFALRLGIAACFAFQSFPLRAEEPDAERRAELQQKLDAKLAELEAIHREVQLLQDELNYRPQLLVHVKMIDVSLTKLAHMAGDWNDLLDASNFVQPPGEETFGTVDLARFEDLIAMRFARLKVSPTIATVVGRPATFHQGGETPIGKGSDGQLTYQRYGTHLELVGTQVGEDRIELKLTAEHSELDKSQPIEIEGKKFPGLRTSKADTKAVLKSGETLLIPGRVENRTDVTLYTDGRKVETLNRIQSFTLVTVELVERPEFTDAPTAGPARSTAAETTLRK